LQEAKGQAQPHWPSDLQQRLMAMMQPLLQAETWQPQAPSLPQGASTEHTFGQTIVPPQPSSRAAHSTVVQSLTVLAAQQLPA